MSKILTYAGREVDLATPKPEDISIVDIAHSLSLLCRFIGHYHVLDSVAEYSVIVPANCSKENKLARLLDDASENYSSNLSGPLKALSELKGYCDLEEQLGEWV